MNVGRILRAVWGIIGPVVVGLLKPPLKAPIAETEIDRAERIRRQRAQAKTTVLPPRQ